MAKGKFEKGRTSAAANAVKMAGGEGKKRGLIVGIICAAVVIVLALVVLIWGLILTNGDTIYPDVCIADVNVGGMTKYAAIGEVESVLEEAYDRTLEVRLPDRTLLFEPDEANVSIDVQEAVELAMGYGRSDGIISAVFNYLGSSRVDIELQMALKMDTEYLEDVITVAANDVRSDPIHTETDITEETITIIKGTPGISIDQQALYERVYGAYQVGDLAPIEWPYVQQEYVEVNLTELHDAMSEQMADAYYDEENSEIVPEVVGYGFDLAAYSTQLESAAYGQKIVIRLEELQPEMTAEKLNGEMFGDKLESRSSPYVNNANRTENLRIACEAINGMILNPGEVFSFNTAVGERTEERGFKPATIYGGDGESVDGVGGGSCQVASTIYYTTLYMNLEQVMREPHMYQVTYVPPGMDATVYWDSGLDYKFRNNLENPIKIQANVDGGHVNITFWGVKENDNYVEMTYKVLETFTSEDEEEVDETKEPGFREQKQTAYTGAKVEAYQKVFDGNGKLITERTIKSTYKSRPNIYIVGPEEETEEENTDVEDPDFDPDDPTMAPPYDPEEDDWLWPEEDEDTFWP